MDRDLLARIPDDRNQPETIATNIEAGVRRTFDQVSRWPDRAGVNDVLPFTSLRDREPLLQRFARRRVFSHRVLHLAEIADQHVCIMQYSVPADNRLVPVAGDAIAVSLIKIGGWGRTPAREGRALGFKLNNPLIGEPQFADKNLDTLILSEPVQHHFQRFVMIS